MKNRSPYIPDKDRKSSSKAGGVDEADRRSVQRKMFVADARIVDLKSGDKLSCRSNDLVSTGCYVDTLNPMPSGRSIHIQLKQGKAMFESNGTVVYSIPSMGMGIAFREVTPENRAVLEDWLSGKTSAGSTYEVNTYETAAPEVKHEDTESLLPPPVDQLTELVLILVKKGILNTSEAARLLIAPR